MAGTSTSTILQAIQSGSLSSILGEVRATLAAAEQGYPGAQSTLGKMYAEGLAIPQDYVQAHMWLALAADQGDAVAGHYRDGSRPKPQQHRSLIG